MVPGQVEPIKRLLKETMSDCICKGNWRSIVKSHEDLLDRTYRETRTGKLFCFVGIVHASDDYYYLMTRAGECRLLTCVGYLDERGHGFELTDEPKETLLDILNKSLLDIPS